MPKGRSVPPPLPRAAPAPVESRVELHPAIPDLGRELVTEFLATDRGVPEAIALAGKTAELATLLIDRAAGAEHVDCRAGCAWCCTFTYIRTSAPEVLRIAAYLRDTLAPNALAAVIQRLAHRTERLAAMREEQRPRARLACALLADQRCTIYPVRPLACQGMTSSSAAACEASYRAGWTRPIPNGPRHLGITMDVRSGVSDGLAEAGLDAAGLDLTAALRIALETPDAGERWLAGEPIFAPAAL